MNLIKLKIRKLIFSENPNPAIAGSRKNQFAPLPTGKAGFRAGVNELIFRKKNYEKIKHRLFKLFIYSFCYHIFPGVFRDKQMFYRGYDVVLQPDFTIPSIF